VRNEVGEITLSKKSSSLFSDDTNVSLAGLKISKVQLYKYLDNKIGWKDEIEDL